MYSASMVSLCIYIPISLLIDVVSLQEGNTALMLAITEAHMRIVEYLVGEGVDTEAKDKV